MHTDVPTESDDDITGSHSIPHESIFHSSQVDSSVSDNSESDVWL